MRLTVGARLGGSQTAGAPAADISRPGGTRATAAAGRDPATERGAHRGWRVRTLLDYRRYAAFSWSWSWRRTIVFGAFGVVLGLWQGTANGLLLDDGRLGLEAGLFAAVVWLVIVSVGPLLAGWVRSRGWPIQREQAGVVGAVLAGIVVGLLGQWLANEYGRIFVLPEAQAQHVVGASYVARAIDFSRSPLVLLSQSVLFFLLSGGLALGTYFGEQQQLAEAQARARELGTLQLQKRQTDLQLLVLQAQIEPHFLFNTLASLRSLLRQDVDRAEAMIDALVEHLRAAMPVFRENNQRATLAEQLRLCGSYLELMRVRLPDRLMYTVDVPEALRSAAFPPLILLTLVENAVKHGIEPKPGPGHIRIGARRERRADGAYLTVTVTDNGVGLSAGLGHGVGLSNIRTQLALKYGGRAALSLMSGAEGGAVASVDIPEADAHDDRAPDLAGRRHVKGGPRRAS